MDNVIHYLLFYFSRASAACLMLDCVRVINFRIIIILIILILIIIIIIFKMNFITLGSIDPEG